MLKHLLLFNLLLIFNLNQSIAKDGPCDPGGPGCQSGGGDFIVHSDIDTIETGTPFSIGIGAGVKSNGKIDTSYSGTVTLKKISGPGNLIGNLSMSFSKFTDLQNLQIDSTGTYELEIDLTGIGKDTLKVIAVKIHGGGPGGGPGPVDLCIDGPGCQNSGGDAIFVKHRDTVEVGKPFDATVAIINKISGKVDTSKHVDATISVIHPSDTLHFGGNLTKPKWVEWNNLQLSTSDSIVKLEIDVVGIDKDTITVIVMHGMHGGGGSGRPGSGGGPGCITSSTGIRENLGLYGGASIDLSFSNSGRLFAAIETPYSIFVSDDTASTWYHAFPPDSLEYDYGRGWGGRALRVLTNQQN